MTPGPESRVRVTGPPRRTTRGRRPGPDDIGAGTRIGAILLDSLISEQRRLGLRVLTALGLSLTSLPLVFLGVPGLAEVRLLGIPLAYLLLWVLVHPLLIGLGWWYVRRAEANERAFTALVHHDERDERPREP